MTKGKFIGLTSIFIIIEQVIKIIINSNYLNSSEPIIEPFLYFQPMFNRDYSWINSLFQFGASKLLHIILVSVIIILVILVYKYLSYKKLNSKIVSIAFSFLLAGGSCSLIDKIFWNGSLDYIYLNGYFTFDLKDAYINIFIGLVLLIFIIDHQGFRTKDDDNFIKDFIAYYIKKNKLR